MSRPPTGPSRLAAGGCSGRPSCPGKNHLGLTPAPGLHHATMAQPADNSNCLAWSLLSLNIKGESNWGGAMSAKSIDIIGKAKLRCLKCGCSFVSWDRRKNRLCKKCKEINESLLRNCMPEALGIAGNPVRAPLWPLM